MKYTVVIRQPVPDDRRAELVTVLGERFGLPLAQAEKLAGRRAGRLMKPTSRARAELLLNMFRTNGANVSLEEVADDAADAPLAMPAMPTPPVPAAPAGSTLTKDASSDALPSAYTTSETLLVTTPSPAAPAMSAAAAPDAFMADAPGTATAVVAPPAPAAVAVVEDAAPAPTGVPAAADDVWSDFTGSLTLPGTRTEEATPAPKQTASVLATSFDAESTETAGPRPRRTSLARRISLTALLPLAVTALTTLALLAFVLPSSQRQLIYQGAQAVATAVGTNLDTTNQDTVYNQLDALLQQSSVGFVQVELPDGTNFFRSKNVDADPFLQERVTQWVQKNPSSSEFLDKDNPVARLKEQLAQLEAVGATDNPEVASLKQRIADPASNKVVSTRYLLNRIGVYQKGDQRVAGPPTTLKGQQPLYRIAIGVPGNESFALVTRTLAIIFALSLLAFALAAYFAARTARRIVQPIEQLVKSADAISLGQLNTPVRVNQNDEVGDLAQALERMRLSLEAAMERLRKRRSRN
ncbi:HAMP domain-containing protein [Deinococcus maricopensis]|uniref:histidine kinase n=1 Tax=Deinococcus maricopensis (strain DSM 21211 / LMG 22137 / NRRL B-23946 / LB-34) TaxID=709986 RepID=E8U7Q3_DEIML|nr:HAMP domain-containing protein [Deinococcus maricopensis]ADV67092.1 histidine kinase HAMP region domain protein [Deinococcus maricopensis DSM 21211]